MCNSQLIRCSVVLRQRLALSACVIRRSASGFSATNCQIDITSLIGQVSHVLLLIGRAGNLLTCFRLFAVAMLNAMIQVRNFSPLC